MTAAKQTLTANTVMALVLPLLFVWDFYLAGVRLLDILALVLLVVFYMNLKNAELETKGKSYLYLAFIFVIILLYSLAGMLSDSQNYKAVIGFSLGSFLFFLVYTMPLEKNRMLPIIMATLVASSLLIFIQLLSYYLMGKIINPLSVIGLEARSLSSIYRPSGVFLEPATYCLSTLMLLSVYDRLGGHNKYILFISILSIYLTLSLWGIASATIFVLYVLRNNKSFVIFLSLAIFLVIASGFILEFTDSPIFKFFENRLTNINSDTSANIRYGGLFSITKLFFTDQVLWTGSGFTNEFTDLGASGWSFIINSIGLPLSLLLMLNLALLAHEKALVFLFFFALFLTAAPLWNYFYWWCCLALYLKSYSPPASPTGSNLAGHNP